MNKLNSTPIAAIILIIVLGVLVIGCLVGGLFVGVGWFMYEQSPVEPVEMEIYNNEKVRYPQSDDQP